MIDSGLNQLQPRADAPSLLGLSCQSINHTERERRSRKWRIARSGEEAKKSQALQADAAKCGKLQIFAGGYGSHR